MTHMHETVLRYEGPPRKTNGYKAELMHRMENEYCRALMDFCRILNGDRFEVVRARYLEAGERRMCWRHANNHMRECRAEARQYAKAAIMVRRRALEMQIQREMAQYNTELAAMGKSFHTERL